MLNGHTPQDTNGIDATNGLFSMDDLCEFDMGKYTVKMLRGSDRLYKLKTDRHARLMDSMAMYRKEKRFCDVVLCVQGVQYPAHKVVLASVSSYFASMFGQSGHIEAFTTEDIDLTKLVPCPRAMNSILDFMYTSRIQLDDKSIMPILTCSIPLLLDDLTELCIAYLRDSLHASNCVGLLLYGKQYLCYPLIEAAENYIFEHFEEVVRHEEFLSLSSADLFAVIKHDEVKVECESIIYNAVMQWVRHNPLNRRAELAELFPCIRFQFLEPSFLKKAMSCDDFSQPDMEPYRDYLSNVHEKLTSHRYCHLPPRRAPIKPLVIYCAGGYYKKSISTMECYFLETKAWKQCADLRVPRSGVGVISLHMRVYVIGGRLNTKNENKDCSDVERYDPFMNKWTSVSSMIYARNRLGVGAIDCNIYAVGGSCGQQIYSSVEVYAAAAPSPQSWVEVASMHVPRIGLAVCTHSRLMYAIGGFDGHRRLAEVESYNPDTNMWTPEQSLRIGRSGAAAAPLAACIYVVGGYASDINEGPLQLDSVEQYNTLTQQWTLVKSMNCRRSALSCVTLDNRLFALGGYDGKHFSSVVEIYDPDKDEWTPGTSLTRERSGHGSALTVEPTLEIDQ
ncbi:unnamed protein product [Rotaria magnacalcarata]|uniref:BTB domain-containing protein n=4 Tax=Rotaria magnacalcarata TaxID=392030 RepID=A0A814YIP3_9BILA|nr:unnamed protein product [Rotaria magnacalcarata]CAF1529518.1 unnamed protein product [Rotaria magnacalcarata]CAF2091098.1 unnamed protein product [Rotaria magnacalcarata]